MAFISRTGSSASSPRSACGQRVLQAGEGTSGPSRRSWSQPRHPHRGPRPTDRTLRPVRARSAQDRGTGPTRAAARRRGTSKPRASRRGCHPWRARAPPSTEGSGAAPMRRVRYSADWSTVRGRNRCVGNEVWKDKVVPSGSSRHVTTKIAVAPSSGSSTALAMRSAKGCCASEQFSRTSSTGAPVRRPVARMALATDRRSWSLLVSWPLDLRNSGSRASARSKACDHTGSETIVVSVGGEADDRETDSLCDERLDKVALARAGQPVDPRHRTTPVDGILDHLLEVGALASEADGQAHGVDGRAEKRRRGRRRHPGSGGRRLPACLRPAAPDCPASGSRRCSRCPPGALGRLAQRARAGQPGRSVQMPRDLSCCFTRHHHLGTCRQPFLERLFINRRRPTTSASPKDPSHLRCIQGILHSRR